MLRCGTRNGEMVSGLSSSPCTTASVDARRQCDWLGVRFGAVFDIALAVTIELDFGGIRKAMGTDTAEQLAPKLPPSGTASLGRSEAT